MPPAPIAFWLSSDLLNSHLTAGGSQIPGLGWIHFAELHGPTLQTNGFTRLLVHNPGGVWARGWPLDTLPRGAETPTDVYNRVLAAEAEAQALGLDHRVMHCDQWELAKIGSGDSATDIACDEALTAFHHSLTLHYGVTEIIYYIGGPDSLTDPLVDGLQAVKPFTNLGADASIAYDLLGYEQLGWRSDWHKAQAKRLLAKVNSLGHKQYLEPSPYYTNNVEKAEWAKLAAGTVTQDTVHVARPETYAQAPEYGEVIRTCTPFDSVAAGVKLWPENVTRCVKDWGFINADDVQPD